MDKVYNYSKIEEEILSFWEENKIYKFSPKPRKTIFSIDTPPPTISGRMHIGHAFSYSHEDFIARYYRMKGKNVFYPFGTDDNGLPTERLIEKENNVKIFEMGRKEFIKLCQNTLKKIAPEFIYDWKRIGMSCDFELYYSTISKEVQKISQKYFIDLYKRGRAYRKEMPTLWCPQCQTAIAQAELEDEERDSFFNYIKFKLLGENKYIIIGTTRPELLSSCVAVFVNPNDKKNKNLIGKTAVVPIFNQKVKILGDKRVDPQKGTGIVMCCTFGDVTDIEWYFDYKLHLLVSIEKDGKLNENAGKYKGLSVKEARGKIIADLEKNNLITKREAIKHIVNTHERCGTEIEILNTTQWFIKYLDLKKEFLAFGRKIKWFPPYMRKRYENWIKGLRWDWCISRQRYFGIPFPVWYCKICKNPLIAEEKDLPIDPTVQKPNKKCSCGSKEFIPEEDVLDTWATSSLTPQIAIELIKNKNIKKKLFPMMLRPQAHDIINFWLFYTVARSKIHFNKIPWKNVMISGFVLDPRGEKMSKSKGNVVLPQEIISNYGADVLRHWSAKASLGEDLRWNEEELKASKRTVVKLWNAARFCLTHIKEVNGKFLLKKKNLEDEDKWILTKLQETLGNYEKYFEKFEFKKAREEIDYFFWKYFCDNYLEIVKPRVYEKEFSKESKKSAKNTLYYCLLLILKLYSPFIPFICEKIFQEIFKNKEKEKSIHQSYLPSKNKNLIFKKETKNFDKVIKIISFIRKQKSEKQLSLKSEIKSLFISSNKIKIERYFNLLSFLMNIKEIKTKKKLGKNGVIEIDNDLKIKILL